MEGGLGWGVVGTGTVARSFAEDLTPATGSRRHVIVSRDAERARRFAEDLSFASASDSLQEALADPALDAVYIGTPHATHGGIALDALRAGKHVLVEKPIGLSRADAELLHEEASARGLFLMEGMWLKFNPHFQRLLEQAAAGAIGDPRSLRASFGIPFPTDTGSRWSAALGGSTLLDQGIYPITLALALFGAPLEVIARGRMRPDGVDLAVHVTLEFAGGRYAQLAASMVDFCELSATVCGTTGWMTLPTPFWAPTRLLTHAGEDRAAFERGVEWSTPLVGNGFTPMIEHVTAAVRDGATGSDIHPMSDALKVFAVMDEVRTQLRNGQDRPFPSAAL